MGINPKDLTKAALRTANIPKDYWEVSFFNYQGPDKAKELSMAYLGNLAEYSDKGVGIMYVGPPGPGKTTLAMIIMKYLARANWNVYCTSLGEIVEGIQREWRVADLEAGAFIRRCRTADYLLIDDVGKEHRGQSGFVQTVFDNLIRHRVQHRQPTFLTTNLTKSELEATYGESAISLLEGRLLPVVVDGEDHRRTVQRNEIRKPLRK